MPHHSLPRCHHSRCVVFSNGARNLVTTFMHFAASRNCLATMPVTHAIHCSSCVFHQTARDRLSWNCASGIYLGQGIARLTTLCLLTSCRKIQSVFELSDGSGLAVTIARYETPAHVDIDSVSAGTEHVRTIYCADVTDDVLPFPFQSMSSMMIDWSFNSLLCSLLHRPLRFPLSLHPLLY